MRRYAFKSVKPLLRAGTLACCMALLWVDATAQQQQPSSAPEVMPGQIAPVLTGLGDHHMPITTASPRAQDFFDQGLRLVYAFNHREAIRAFQEAARLDPECAMAYWGQALALGPNLNQMMQPDNVGPAYDAIQKALKLADKASGKERDFIGALAARYGAEPVGDRSALDRAYADAMADVAAAYPEDDDAQVLYAAALMNTMPWNYYTRDGVPRPDTVRVLNALETVFARNPDHAGAHHYYIHATEEHYPQKSEGSADKLATLTPGAGHLVHMPSHVYMRVGRYADAYESNRLAVQADEGYITQCRQQGIYPLAYYPHNIHFLAWSAQRQGRSAEAIREARKVSAKARESMAGADFALYESFYMMPFYMLVRFGKWDAILDEPQPATDAPYAQGIWRYARALAFVNTGATRKAKGELDALRDIINDATFEGTVGFADPSVLLTIAAEIVEGELLAQAQQYDEAVSHLERAVRLQDNLMYNEPPDWYYPVRHTLGAVLLEAGRADEAESVYWTDLKQNPENGFALFGLWQSLLTQGRLDDAKAVEARFKRVWANADVELTSSRF